jgi:hypothetical protein
MIQRNCQFYKILMSWWFDFMNSIFRISILKKLCEYTKTDTMDTILKLFVKKTLIMINV